jgi:hypothetical protein
MSVTTTSAGRCTTRRARLSQDRVSGAAVAVLQVKVPKEAPVLDLAAGTVLWRLAGLGLCSIAFGLLTLGATPEADEASLPWLIIRVLIVVSLVYVLLPAWLYAAPLNLKLGKSLQLCAVLFGFAVVTVLPAALMLAVDSFRLMVLAVLYAVAFHPVFILPTIGLLALLVRFRFVMR